MKATGGQLKSISLWASVSEQPKRVFLATQEFTAIFTLCNLHNILSIDTAPVIGTVDAKALSLSDVQVTVTLSDTGGQPVVECTVSLVIDS